MYVIESEEGKNEATNLFFTATKQGHTTETLLLLVLGCDIPTDELGDLEGK